MSFREAKSKNISFVNRFFDLPIHLQKKAEKSWAGEFRTHVYDQIDESLFKDLFTDNKGRPCNSIKYIFCVELLKQSNNLTDEEAIDAMYLDPRFQYAVDSTNVIEQPLSANSLNRFRRKLRGYEEKTGIDLIKLQYDILTKKYMEATNTSGLVLRMDSTLVSNRCKYLERANLANKVTKNMCRQLIKDKYETDKALIDKYHKEPNSSDNSETNEPNEDISYRLKPSDVSKN
ncbi:MAG: transposase [Christensenellaceae bacterium]|jgi:hypothetical protein|nr:transposase [Christensenellaceae bacterium]